MKNHGTYDVLKPENCKEATKRVFGDLKGRSKVRMKQQRSYKKGV